MIKYILFDMCGVLIEDTYDMLLREVAKSKGIDSITFMSEIRDDWNLMEKGYINEKEVFKRIINKFSLKLKIDEIRKELVYGFVKIKGVWDIVEILKKKNSQLVIASNMGEEIVKQEMKELQLEKYFDLMFFSSSTHSRKPEYQYFNHIIKSLNVRPEECLFIDDKKRNIDAAIKLGINGIVFETPKQLKEELVKLKII